MGEISSLLICLQMLHTIGFQMHCLHGPWYCSGACWREAQQGPGLAGAGEGQPGWRAGWSPIVRGGRTRSSTAYCRWPCFGRRVGLYDSQRSLPTPTILWFCDSVKWTWGWNMAATWPLVWLQHPRVPPRQAQCRQMTRPCAILMYKPGAEPHLHDFIESENHRMIKVGRDLEDHLVPTTLPWAGTFSTRPGCSELHPAWPWTLPGSGIHSFSGQPVPVFHHPHGEEFPPNI